MHPTTTSPPTAMHDGEKCSRGARVTKSLLGYGVLAGPSYVLISLAQALLHEPFDLTRHGWSQLAAGPHGWIQAANLFLTGAMVIACAIGVARSAFPSRWTPRLLGVYGVGLCIAGVLVADPANGYPAGAEETVTWQGIGHFVASSTVTVLTFTAAIVMSWGWLAWSSIDLYRDTARRDALHMRTR